MGDIEGRFVSIFRLSTRASTLRIAGCNQNFLPPPSPLRAEDGQGLESGIGIGWSSLG